MHLRSKIKQLKIAKDALEVLSAQLKAKSAVDKNFQGFHEQCKKMVEGLSEFIAKSVDKQAEVTYVSDTDKAAAIKSLGELEALLTTADHHQGGADGAKKRFSSMLK